MKTPDFYIVGAPKSGTTSLYRYLKDHPRLCMSTPKEPHHFGSDLRKYSPIVLFNDNEEYVEKCFADCDENKLWGEASASYLYSAKAAEEIKNFSPNAKIIIMLRNPVNAAYSFYSQKVFGGSESAASFEDALNLIDNRLLGKNLPKHPGIIETFDYVGTYMYYDQVKRYIDIFGRENILIIKFDDFKNDTLTVYKQLVDFLGIDSSYIPTFTVENANKVNKSKFLNSLIVHPSYLRDTVKKIIPSSLVTMIGKKFDPIIQHM